MTQLYSFSFIFAFHSLKLKVTLWSISFHFGFLFVGMHNEHLLVSSIEENRGFQFWVAFQFDITYNSSGSS